MHVLWLESRVAKVKTGHEQTTLSAPAKVVLHHTSKVLIMLLLSEYCNIAVIDVC